MAPTPAPMSTNNLFGAALASPAAVPAPPVPALSSIVVGGPTPSEVNVHGFFHGGLSVDFACNKPGAWNKQLSVLVARL